MSLNNLPAPISEWNGTVTDYPRDTSIQTLFASIVRQYGERDAVILPDVAALTHERLTYGQLDLQSDALAAYLQQQGVKPGEAVGLYVERSLEMVVAMLAVLKAGAVYVPLDPAYPSERLLYMLQNSSARVVLTSERLRGQLALDDDDVAVFCLNGRDAVPWREASGGEPVVGDGDGLACLLYTSGSTGRPKGVETPHRSIVRLVMGTDYVRFDASRLFLQLVPISFDVAEFEIWGALLHGATCVLYPGHGVPDPLLIGRLLKHYRVTTLWLTCSLFNTIVDDDPTLLSPVEELLVGGEALSVSHVIKAMKALPQTQLINGYGPTESNITTFYRIPPTLSADASSVPIGRPIANSTVYLLDENLSPLPVGEEGEIYIGGDGVARGYRNEDEMTAASFIADPFSDRQGARLYKTGDRARYLSGGDLAFIGRVDDQVKINGHRIELGEVEACLRSHPDVTEAGVVVHPDSMGQKRLLAHVAFERGRENLQGVRCYAEAHLPDFMVPQQWFELASVPLTANGKLDRRALPLPEALRRREEVDSPFVEPATQTGRKLAELWSGLLAFDRVGEQDNFFDLGGTSLLALQCMVRIRQQLGVELPVAYLFEYPTIATLARVIDEGVEAMEAVSSPQIRQGVERGVAIVGMAGRFPGANDIEQFWQNLCAGEESITFFDLDQIDASVSESVRKAPNYVAARGVVEGIDQFDAAFFGMSPQEAKLMDPQQRLFLEVAWQALEHSGHDPERYKGAIGVYAGMNSNTYYANNVVHHPEQIQRLGAFQTMLANEKDYLATRVAFKFGLTGPAVSVYTACSTSLSAICQAFDAIRQGRCDVALAGGVSIIVPQNSGYLYQEGGMFASDGHCRPFDAAATGTTFNSGVGVVVLKDEEEARRDGDTLYAVIRGAGLNNDGGGKASFTAPSIDGQARVIRMAQAQADFAPHSISYVETHGTGTPLGDPIEFAGLVRAFGQEVPRQRCAIGSLKGNVGHLIHAAGVAAVIKMALALKHKTLPPSINFDQPNPNIDFANSPFYVVNRQTAWAEGETPRRCGVSSFGVGGTNAHIVMEEARSVESNRSTSRPRQLLLLSARTDTALSEATTRLGRYLASGQRCLADVAYTLQTGRRQFVHRRALVCSEGDAAARLAELPRRWVSDGCSRGSVPPVVFMFPGQGSQYVNMGGSLYESEPVFRTAVDECCELLQPQLDSDLRAIIYPEGGRDEAQTRLAQTGYTQPALFTVEYALAQLWRSWGVAPQAMIGHSIGEFVAACLAGVFSLEDALSLVAERARLMQAQPTGGMLSIRRSAEQVTELLDELSSIAAINGSALCVASGPHESMAHLRQRLESEGVACRLLHTSHAFHSPMMEPVIEPFLARCKAVSLSPPKIPFVSTVTAQWISDAEATDPHYWARHLRETVRFAEGVKCLWGELDYLMLEVGPRTTATTLARQQVTDRRHQLALPSLGDSAESDGEWETLLLALGQLWVQGVDIDWRGFYQYETRQKTALPSYPFERTRYWLDAPGGSSILTEPRQEQNRLDDPIMPETLPPTSPPTRLANLANHIRQVMGEVSGMALDEETDALSFLALGFDSLVLTQASLALKNHFKTEIAFRQLMEEFTCVDELAAYFDQVLPAEAFAVSESASVEAVDAPPANAESRGSVLPVTASPLAMAPDTSAAERVISQQLQIMQQQLAVLGGSVVGVTPADPVTPAKPSLSSADKAVPETESKSAHGPGAKIQRTASDELNAPQKEYLSRFSARFNRRTAKSKAAAQRHRPYLADPRTVSGFKPYLKELVYPIVVDRSEGSRMWDIDGNEYIDLTCGFGSNIFGWGAPFIIEAMEQQLRTGYEIGPQAPLAGEIAQRVCEMTGNERVAFCNTGSEAVLGAIRLARTVTGRKTVVIFKGGYHGIVDEVIARGSGSLKSLPAAPGIPPEAVANVLVLEYGTAVSMEVLRARKDELAAVLVETVQSRRPDLQPFDFIRELRQLTEESGAALIFDEVITGFRVHRGGMQGYMGVRADLATYGKVIGGGQPMGLIGGTARFMDALDGGQWQFGDESIPEVGVTFFAGTFVRHPVALAAAKAVLDKMDEEGPALQERLAERTAYLAKEVNGVFEAAGVPYRLPHFSSFYYLDYPAELSHGGLLYYVLREKGIHIWEGRPCFLTTAHSDEDLQRVVDAFRESVAALQRGGFLPQLAAVEGEAFDADKPPVAGARLGKDPEGNPAWYIEDPDRPGKYLRVES